MLDSELDRLLRRGARVVPHFGKVTRGSPSNVDMPRRLFARGVSIAIANCRRLLSESSARARRPRDWFPHHRTGQ
jgi:hypothetical protein